MTKEPEGGGEVEVDLDEFYFLADDDQKLRAFILSYMGNADIDGRILVANMEACFHWVKDGKVPTKATAPKPKVVEKSDA